MTSEREIELLPCPFCGNAVELEHHTVSNESETYGYWGIECLRHAGLDGSVFCGVHADEPAEAIAAWNRRSPTPERDATLEDAAELLDLRAQDILLIAGEMSAQEVRSVRAMLNERARAIRSLKSPPRE